MLLLFNEAEQQDMKTVKLVHNPSAGDEEHSMEHLVQHITDAGFECRYSSTNEEEWKNLEDDVDFVAIAGGDGTVRKLVKRVLKKEKNDLPLAVLALGTANNIAKTFDIDTDTNKTVQAWKNATVKSIDIGLIDNVPEEDFFLEGMGFGIFPFLMKEMKKAKENFASPEEELRAALKKLHGILLEYEPRECSLEVDGTDHSGKFFMVEVMNIRSIGPNMMLAPQADPGDGEFEIVLVPEAHRQKFSEFLLHRIAGSNDDFHFHTLKGRNIKIRWDGTRLHVDDKMLKLEKETEIVIKIKEKALKFLRPAEV
jgi:diacylglycerol kinase family enzyme